MQVCIVTLVSGHVWGRRSAWSGGSTDRALFGKVVPATSWQVQRCPCFWSSQTVRSSNALCLGLRPWHRRHPALSLCSPFRTPAAVTNSRCTSGMPGPAWLGADEGQTPGPSSGVGAALQPSTAVTWREPHTTGRLSPTPRPCLAPWLCIPRRGPSACEEHVKTMSPECVISAWTADVHFPV